MRQGSIWRVNGVFKLAYDIDLDKIQQTIGRISREATDRADQNPETLVDHYQSEIVEAIGRKASPPPRKPRYSERGSPDAADGNRMRRRETIINKLGSISACSMRPTKCLETSTISLSGYTQ
ncbi:uncharacterized protein LOC6620378 [Drosophila sechellia]|uniref:GM10401 n=1 Tax=Drosophila sechellia TaxID=7238 RepID=B4ILH8_DROSE|nr:uncharacterized protein LOC6620378 [Drosophila sechellia]EDW53850.1 GM10401 [Drosophila sechellia]